MSLLKTENVYKHLREKAASLNTTVADIARGANVERKHFQYWKNETPSTICTLVKLNQEIERREKLQNENSQG